ncbi:hypothetical protein SLOPH_1121 [Spraguea lophii 42_110]|uniref:ApeA N-terminal domain-containing protein n=1 Tax=Spraguea lophii (strain 42_110) TaxID=1358809 RepID=S7XVT0_SPRLO|nr:hypothetical protein SLOPH_1121 [Spraguea lophii 42_110]
MIFNKFVYLMSLNYIFLSRIVCATYEEYEFPEEKIENVKNIWNNDLQTQTYLTYEGDNFWLNDTEFMVDGIGISLTFDHNELFEICKSTNQNDIKRSFDDMNNYKNEILNSDNIIDLVEALTNYNVFRIEYLKYVVNEFNNESNLKKCAFKKAGTKKLTEMGGYYYLNIDEQKINLNNMSYGEEEYKLSDIARCNLYKSEIMRFKLAGEYPKIRISSMQIIPHITSTFNNYMIAFTHCDEYIGYLKELRECYGSIRRNKLSTPEEKIYSLFWFILCDVEQVLKDALYGKLIDRKISKTIDWEKLMENINGDLSVDDVKVYIYLSERFRNLALHERGYFSKKGDQDLLDMVMEKFKFFSKYLVVGKDISYKSLLKFCEDFTFKTFNYENYQIFIQKDYIK